MNNTVAAVIPAYNAEKYIKQSILALLNQTMPIDEIIVIDDASTDETYQIIKNTIQETKSNNIRLVQNERNSGASFSRNIGINLSESDWIIFMDADDVAHSELVEKLLTRYRKLEHQVKEEYVLIHGAYQQIDAEGNISELVTRFKQVGKEEILGYELLRNHVYLSGTAVKKKALLEFGGFDQSITYCEDWDLWLKLADSGGFLYVDDPLFYVRRHGENISSKVENVLQGEKKILSKYSLVFIKEAILKRNLTQEQNMTDFVGMMFRLGYWREGHQQIEELLADNSKYAPAYFLKGLYHIQYNDLSTAKIHFIRAIELNPIDAASWNNLGVCYAVEGNRTEAFNHLNKSKSLIQNYMDCAHNLDVIGKENKPTISQMKVTWRELRPVLLQYT